MGSAEVGKGTAVSEPMPSIAAWGSGATRFPGERYHPNTVPKWAFDNEIGQHGIDMSSGKNISADTGTFTWVVQGNTINAGISAPSGQAIFATAGTAVGDMSCVHSTIGGAGALTNSIGGAWSGSAISPAQSPEHHLLAADRHQLLRRRLQRLDGGRQLRGDRDVRQRAKRRSVDNGNGHR
jgi:hypothetical protein